MEDPPSRSRNSDYVSILTQKREYLVLLLLVYLVAYNNVAEYFQINAKVDERLRMPVEAPIETALVMRTHAPIRTPVLKKIYQLAIELNNTKYPYDFWLLVDETKATGSQDRVNTFFDKHDSNVERPRLYIVSEKMLFENYPKLVSYAYNEPEANSHNQPGLCCGQPIMWQMGMPTFGLFMNQTRYKYGWSFEDDIGVEGQLSLLELIRLWDMELLNMDIDLAAIDLKRTFWGAPIHTKNMQQIVDNMNNASEDWTMYSDAIQRHSLALSESVVAEVSNNVMQFGERLIKPIAWKHNHSIVDLEQLSVNTSILGLDRMTGYGKLPEVHALEFFLNSTETPVTYVFHEDLPQRRRVLLVL